jgi:signal transduction histidine kinase
MPLYWFTNLCLTYGRIYIFVVIAGLFISQGQALGSDPKIKILSSQFYAPETNQEFDIEHLRHLPEANWLPAKSNYGFSHNSVYIKMTVRVENGSGDLYSVSLPMLADVGEMWILERGEIIAHSLSGSMVPRAKWTSNRTFTGIDFHCSGTRELDIFGRIKHSSRILATPTVELTAEKTQSESNSRVIWYIFLGASLVLCVHNFGLFFAARDSVFVSYLLFIVTMIISLSGVWGASSAMIASVAPSLGDKIRVFHALTSFVIVQMVESYIERNSISKKITILIDAFKFLVVCIVIGAFFDASTVMNISAIASILMVPLLYSAAINAIMRGHSHVWYAIGALMGPTIAFLSNHIIFLMGYEPPAKELLTVGFLAEGAIMSFGMTERVRRLRNLVLENVEKQNELLEKMVAERTEKLENMNATLASEVRERKDAQTLAEERSKVIKDQQSRLLSAARSQAVSNLSIGVSHEINNPLAIAQGNLFIVEQKLKALNPVDESALGAAASAQRAIVRISQIVRSLRDLTELMKPSILVHQSAERVFDLVSKSAKNDDGVLVPISVEFSSLTHSIEVDEPALGQILTALLNNAANAASKMPEPWIKFSARTDGAVVEYRVTDSGHGISDDVATHMFDPFFSTGSPGGHKGLGLTSAKILCESMNGTLTYDATARHTTFVITLPCAAKGSQESDDLADSNLPSNF